MDPGADTAAESMASLATYPPSERNSTAPLLLNKRQCKPPLRNWKGQLSGLMNMILFLGHPAFIQCSLRDTQASDSSGNTTDLVKWKSFSETFQKDTDNVNLLVSEEYFTTQQSLNLTRLLCF
ncbi:hypothetical protein ID866_12713 [Astraeus odoratus]|nr:hypothetical protein ID866_12713 [Astraeus odoratus]